MLNVASVLQKGLPTPFIALLTCACSASSSPALVEVSHTTAGAYEAALAAFDDGFAVAWYDTRDGNAEIYARWLDLNGSPHGAEMRLTDDAALSYEVSVDAAGRDLAVAWYDKAADGVLTARIGLWDRNGARKWFHSMPAGTRNPVVRGAGDRLFVAWIQQDAGGEAVWGGWWAADGRRLGKPSRLAPASRTTWNVNLVLDDRHVPWVAFDAAAGTRASELFLVRAGDIPEVIPMSGDDGVESKYPDVAIAGGNVAFTWFDERDGNREVYLTSVRADRLTTVDASEIVAKSSRRVTTSPGESIGAYVAWSSGRIGLAWSDSSEGQHEVYFQPFDRGGAPLAEARRMTESAAASLIPAIRGARDGFALAWNEYDARTRDGHADEARSEIVFALVP